MGEIKSTLELVMEKTRHLTLSEEEKRELALSDFRKSLNGMVQKFMDEVFNLEQFKEEWNSLESKSGIRDRSILVDLVVERMDLDRDNQRLLILLADACGSKAEVVASLLSQYREMVRSRSEVRKEQFKKDLWEQRGIGGSSVMPNLLSDSAWGSEQEVLRSRFAQDLREEITKLKMV